MTTATTMEIEQYYDRVRAALDWLEPEVRDELLEDLPDHLAEVQAEVSADGTGSLQDRLGAPEDYADELRIAAGIEAAEPTAPEPPSKQEAFAAGLRRARQWASGFDRQAGQLVGYPRLLELLRAIRPGWWVLRGWIVAVLLCHNASYNTGLIPRAGDSRLLGALVTLAAIAGSVWLGRRSLRFSLWPGLAMSAISVALAVAGYTMVHHDLGGTFLGAATPSNGYFDPTASVSDVYVYGQDGRLVPNARLYDQNGNPIQLGSGGCANGSGFSIEHPGPDGALSYPLCPQDNGPFRSGPGALGAAPSGSASDSAASATPSSTAPSSAPSSAARTSPGAKRSSAPTASRSAG